MNNQMPVTEWLFSWIQSFYKPSYRSIYSPSVALPKKVQTPNIVYSRPFHDRAPAWDSAAPHPPPHFCLLSTWSLFFFLLPPSLSVWRTSTDPLKLRSTIPANLKSSPIALPGEIRAAHVSHSIFPYYYFSFPIGLINPLNFQEIFGKRSWLCPEDETFPKDPSSGLYSLPYTRAADGVLSFFLSSRLFSSLPP